MSLSREERKLLHQKSKQPTTGVGKPSNAEGYDGDVSFRQIEDSGTVQYVKQSNEWTAIGSSGAMPSQRPVGGTGGGTGTGPGVSSHNSLSGLGGDDHPHYILADGTRAFTGSIEVGSAAGSGVDAKFYTAGTAAHVGLHWDADSNTEGTLIGGVDNHGVDFKFFGETSGKYVQWDMSGDVLVLGGTAQVDFNSAGSGEYISGDGTSLSIVSGGQINLTAATNVVNNSSYITDHSINSKPASNGRHFATGDADFQQNYCWVGLYDQIALASEHDVDFGTWGAS